MSPTDTATGISSVTEDGFEIRSNSATPEEMTASLKASDTDAAFPGAGEPAKAVEPAVEATADAEPAEAADPSPESVAGKELAKKKGSLQARIDRLTFDKHATERERDEARAEIAQLREKQTALETKPTETAPVAAPAVAQRPKLEDFATHEDWVEAVSDWKADQKVAAAEARLDARLAKQREEDGQRAQQTEQQRQRAELDQQWFTRLDDTRKTHTDFDTVVATARELNLPAPPPMIDAHLKHSSLGGELLYHLMTHPEEYQQLCTLNAGPQLVALGKLEARLEAAATPASPARPTDARSGPSAVAPSTSRAKPVIKPVTSGAVAAEDGPPDDTASFEEHQRYWDAEDQKERRRA